jgi:phospholipid/cholesterol/gamma-HCH transport system substrate-binding protein
VSRHIDPDAGPGRLAGSGRLARAGSALGAAAGAVGARVPRPLRLVAAVVAVAVVAGLVLFWPQSPRTEVTAEFSRAVGLYPGSDVRILGIKVGEVLSVEPAGEVVRVVLEYDSDYDVPADARAAVVAPSVVSDRYVQLLPVYTGSGPVLADGARIPLERTAVPVELDRIYSSLDELAVALGPTGANADGALSRLLETGAANLDGQGEALGTTVRDLSLALDAVAGDDDDLFATVRNLQVLTSTLAAHDDQVRTLNSNLATVADQLAGQRDDLAAALANLAVALDEVSTFVEENRQVLGDDVAALEDVTASVVAEQDAFAETLTNAPLALGNLNNAYNARSGTLDTRDNADQVHDPAQFVCSMLSGAVAGSTPDPALCRQLLPALSTLIGATGVDTSGLPLGQLSRVPPLEATTTPVASDPTLAGILAGDAP